MSEFLTGTRSTATDPGTPRSRAPGFSNRPQPVQRGRGCKISSNLSTL